MWWEKIKALLTKLGFDIKEKEAELKAEIDKLEKDADGNIDLSKLDLKSLLGDDNKIKDNPALKILTDTLAAAMQEIKDLKATLGKELIDREAAVKAQQEKTKADFEKKVADRIDKALKDKMIVEADKELWRGRLTKDYDEWDKELSAKQMPKEFQSKKTEPGSDRTPATTGNKTLDAVLQHTQNSAIEKPFLYDSLTK